MFISVVVLKRKWKRYIFIIRINSDGWYVEPFFFLHDNFELKYNSDCHLILFPWSKSYNQIEILILTSNEYESLSFLRKLIGFSLIVFFHHKIVIYPSNFLKWWYLIHAFYKVIAFGHDGYNGITIQIRKKIVFPVQRWPELVACNLCSRSPCTH